MTTQPGTPPARGIRIPQPIAAEQDMPHPIAARLALEVLWQQFTSTVPGHLEPEEEAVNAAMRAMHAMLWRRERQAAADTGQYTHYLIIRPVNPLNLPAPARQPRSPPPSPPSTGTTSSPAPGPTRTPNPPMTPRASRSPDASSGQ